MKRRISILALLALALACFALPAFAAGRPDVTGPAPWANSENGRMADNGEILYRCGTEARGNHQEIPQAQIDRWISENRIVAGGVIPVYFHVIYGAEGNVSDADVAQQIQVLNYNYAGKDYNGNTIAGAANTGYTFQLINVSHTKNNKWYRMTPGTGAEQQAKAALGVNQGSALNIYSCKPGQNLLGWSYFPQDMAGQTLDGVVIHYGSLPNGYLSPYNLGGTATHEVGHYLGLYHTFQDGCAGGDASPGCTTGGDRVCDTAAEASATSGCPAGKNTCASGGDDPIHNYMDYSTDICYTNFTAGQDTRMNTIVTAYRSWVGATRIANNAGSLQNAAGKQVFSFRAVPNPFNPRTKIEFATVREGRASVRVFDIQGRLVATVVDRKLAGGNHQYDFDASKLSSGVYLMVLKAEGRPQEVRRLSLLK